MTTTTSDNKERKLSKDAITIILSAKTFFSIVVVLRALERLATLPNGINLKFSTSKLCRRHHKFLIFFRIQSIF